MKCKFCEGKCVKNGFQSTGNQRYKCSKCNRRQQEHYCYNAYKSDIDKSIVQFTKEGLGIRSTARILRISTTTLLRRIIAIAKSLRPPVIPMHKIYEVDEMRSYVKSKDRQIWIVYALERETRKVISFHVGRRTNTTLNVVLNTVKLAKPLAVYTDKLKQYRYLIDESIHKTKRYGINHIERKNLSIRTHLKRLNRRTICYSRSKLVLAAVLKIYFWM